MLGGGKEGGVVRMRLEIAERSDRFVAGARARIEVGTLLGVL